jgi:hypothetical protein
VVCAKASKTIAHRVRQILTINIFILVGTIIVAGITKVM